MASNFRIISYNCQSVNTNLNLIQSFLPNCDILFLQETLLNDDNCSILEKLDSDFCYAHIPSVRNNQFCVGRPSGGLAILWRNFKNIKFEPVYFTNRVMGLRLVLNELSYLMLNIYCYCDYGNIESLLNYKSMMADLSNICDEETFDEIIILGDMNADPSKGRFFYEFKTFIDSHAFYLRDVECLDRDTYTYISHNQNCSTS